MTSTAYQPDCQMLCASGAAYTIVPKSPWAPPEKDNPNYRFYEAARFAAAPTAIQGGPADIDACLVGKLETGVVVAFRGTLPIGNPPTSPELLDWLQDLLVPPTSVDGWADKIRVHTGFWEALDSVWAPLKSTLGAMDLSHGLYFTGHSKGGPLASLAAYRYWVEETVLSSTITFASPHPGNSAFATAFKQCGLVQTRWENYLDVVPVLPPVGLVAAFLKGYVQSEKGIPEFLKRFVLALLGMAEEWDYSAVGKGWFIDSSGECHKLGVLEDGVQLEALKTAIEAQEYDKIAAAHCHSCYAENGSNVTCAGGYMKGVCRGTVCPV